MVTPIRVPDLGTTVDEVKLVSWLADEGAAVKQGDLLAEIETDKASTQLESVAAGTLLKRLRAPGDMVRTGDVIAYVGHEGETLPAEETPHPRPQAPPARPRVSPMVANLATKMGLDLAHVKGTGPGGVITRDDLLASPPAGSGSFFPQKKVPDPNGAKIRH